jgi:hypothetical protein
MVWQCTLVVGAVRQSAYLNGKMLALPTLNGADESGHTERTTEPRMSSPATGIKSGTPLVSPCEGEYFYYRELSLPTEKQSATFDNLPNQHMQSVRSSAMILFDNKLASCVKG